jgi:hypothetical protein
MRVAGRSSDRQAFKSTSKGKWWRPCLSFQSPTLFQSLPSLQRAESPPRAGHSLAENCLRKGFDFGHKDPGGRTLRSPLLQMRARKFRVFESVHTAAREAQRSKITCERLAGPTARCTCLDTLRPTQSITNSKNPTTFPGEGLALTETAQHTIMISSLNFDSVRVSLCISLK